MVFSFTNLNPPSTRAATTLRDGDGQDDVADGRLVRRPEEEECGRGGRGETPRSRNGEGGGEPGETGRRGGEGG